MLADTIDIIMSCVKIAHIFERLLLKNLFVDFWCSRKLEIIDYLRKTLLQNTMIEFHVNSNENNYKLKLEKTGEKGEQMYNRNTKANLIQLHILELLYLLD